MSEITVHIKCSNSDKAEIKIETTATVYNLKEKVGDALNVPASQQRLIYKGRVLKDELSLENYEVQDGHTVHMVKGASAAAAAAGARPLAVAPPNAPSSSSAAPPPLPNPFAGVGEGLGNNPFLANMNNPQAIQEQLMRNPEMMSQIMNSPMMRSLLDNPYILRNMMTSNPQMQALLDSNPQIRHILNDPAILRQSMEMMRNPNAMREAMRSNDLAMSQLENLPGGFNALRRMFEEVQEPMMEAMGNNNSTAPVQNNAPVPPSTTPANTAVPNPWGGAGNANPSANPAAGGLGNNPFTNPFANPMMGMGGGDMAQMMNDPAMQQMMSAMFSDPAMLQQMSTMNPQLAAALQNPQTRAMLSNPAFLQQVTNPANMTAIMQMQQAMQTLQQNGLMPAGAGFPGMGFGAGMGVNNNFNRPTTPVGGLNFDSLFATNPGNPAAPAPPVAAAPGVDPSVRYAAQLQQLRDMGFSDEAANLVAIQATRGNVNAAVERLLSGGGL